MSARPPERGPRRPRTAAQHRNLAKLCAVGLAIGVVGTVVTATQDSGLAAVSGGSGQRAYNVSGFEGVSATGSADVEVSVGPAFSARGTGSAGALDRYEVVVENGMLKIQPKRSAWWGQFWSGSRGATFYVTLPQLSSATLAGSGDMKIDKVSGPKFAADLQGSGDLEVAALAVDQVQLSLAGSGDMSVSGRAGNARVSVAGSGDMEASGLSSTTADVAIFGSGDVALTVANAANVSVAGSGDVSIGGSAHCNVSRSGSGDVTCPS